MNVSSRIIGSIIRSFFSLLLLPKQILPPVLPSSSPEPLVDSRQSATAEKPRGRKEKPVSKYLEPSFYGSLVTDKTFIRVTETHSLCVCVYLCIPLCEEETSVKSLFVGSSWLFVCRQTVDARRKYIKSIHRIRRTSGCKKRKKIFSVFHPF